MKSIKTLSILAVVFLAFAFQSCKKDKTTIVPTTFTFNGEKYTTVKSYVNLRYFSFGGTYYSALIDSAVNADKSKFILFTLGFDKVGRPEAAEDYYVYVPSGLPASTPNLITPQVFEFNFTNRHYTVYETTNSGADQTATVTDNGKLTVDFPETSFDGSEYDSTGTLVNAISSFLFSQTTFKEQ